MALVRFFLCVVLTLCAAALSAAPSRAEPSTASDAKAQQPATLAELLGQLAALQGLRARYVEEKRIAFLKQPLRSEGSVTFAAPGLLLRKAERPEPSAMLLDGDLLRVWDGRSVRRIELGESPIVRHFVMTFVYVLRGDRAALERLYTIAFSTKDAQWQLELAPKEAALTRFVKRATLEGSGVQVARMTLIEASGDKTVMTFADVDTSARFDKAARDRTFRLPGD
jgi:outer membrane lipoprotein-sorting protein